MDRILLITSVVFSSVALQAAPVVGSSDKLYVDRPRGVPLTLKALYDSSQEFKCLDGSKTIPFDHVNDDYCDCKDGSDEPGTAACPRGRFHCVNLGHSPVDVPSSRVNDQICDCCDGSDEWSGLVTCPDICDELGRAAREAAQKRVEVVKDGFQKRKQLSADGAKIKQEKEKQLEEFRKQKDELDPKRDELDMKKQDVEKIEQEAKDKFKKAWEEDRDAKRKVKAIEAFGELDVNKDQKITPDELQTRLEFDKDGGGSVSDDEAKDYLNGKDEANLDRFIDEVWDGMRKIYRPLTDTVTSTPTPEKVSDVPPPTDPPPPTTTPSPVEPPAPPIDDEYKEGDEDEEEVKEDDVDDFDEEKYMEGKVHPPADEDDDDVMPAYDAPTQAAIDAADAVRKDYNEVDNKFRDIENEIKNTEAFINTDFGTEFEWAPLKGQCLELTESQYLYKLCLFDRMTQRDKSGGAETTLGNWDKWDGPETAPYSVQRYAKGQSCWNGPERSTEVHVSCGSETRLLGANEPGRCEYRVELETPAACPDPASFSDDQHTEL